MRYLVSICITPEISTTLNACTVLTSQSGSVKHSDSTGNQNSISLLLRLTPWSECWWDMVRPCHVKLAKDSSILTRCAGWHCRDACATCADVPTALCSCPSPTRGPWYSQPSAQPGTGPSHLLPVCRETQYRHLLCMGSLPCRLLGGCPLAESCILPSSLAAPTDRQPAWPHSQTQWRALGIPCAREPQTEHMYELCTNGKWSEKSRQHSNRQKFKPWLAP